MHSSVSEGARRHTPRATKLTGLAALFLGWLLVLLDGLMDLTAVVLLPGGQNPLYVLGAAPFLLGGAIWVSRDDQHQQ